MVSEEPLYVIDERLATYPMTSALKVREKLWLHPDLPQAPGLGAIQGPGDTPLPVSPNGSLAPGILYPSSNDPGVRYYLPQYQLHLENGHYTTRLKFRGPSDDPNGPLGWLTIELDAVVPAANGFVLREIDHSAIVCIAYQMTVNDSTGHPIMPVPAPTHTEDGSQPGDFVGNWVNTNVNTQNITRLQIASVNATTLSFHGFGKCEPSDCDWGVINVPFTPGTTVGIYNFGFKTTQITVQCSGNLLTATTFDHYAPGDGRADHTITETFSRAGAGAPPVPRTGPTLWIEVGTLEHTPQNVRRCQKAIFLKQDFDRLYQIMTDSNFRGQLEIHCFATIGRRTWRQIVLAPISPATQLTALVEKQALISHMLNANTLQAVKPDVLAEPSKVVTLQQDRPEEILKLRLPEFTAADPTLVGPTPTPATPVTPSPIIPVDARPSPVFHPVHELSPDILRAVEPATPVVAVTPAVEGARTATMLSTVELAAARETLAPSILTLRPSAAMTNLFNRTEADLYTLPIAHIPVATAASVSLQEISPTLPHVALARVYAPEIKAVLPQSDLQLQVNEQAQSVIPVNVALTPGGLPALLQISVEALETVTPFFFLKDTNAYMFDIPGDIQPSTNHVLIKLNTTNADGSPSGTFYQDSAFRDLFYFQPQEFRLSRLPTYPYLPDMVIAFLDVVSQDPNQPANATALYRVELSYRALPYLDPQAREDARAQLADPGTTPRFAALEPLSSKLTLNLPPNRQLNRPSALVQFSEGVVDSIDLSSTDFEQIFALFQDPAGIGISGTIQATLFDNTQVSIPLKLSLQASAGPLFDRVFDGPVAAPSGQYQMRLRNRIESPVQINSLPGVHVTANAVATPVNAPIGAVLQPGQTLQLTYQVTPATTQITDIEPALTTSIQPNYALLWSSLMINQGYTSDTFSINVSIDPAFFGSPPAGMEPLTGVQVEFQYDASVTLTSTQSAMDLTLRLPLLARLLKDPNAQQYNYRVTNLHARGAGARTSWKKSEGDLSVTPAPSSGG